MNTSTLNDLPTVSELLSDPESILVTFVCNVVNLVLGLPTHVYILWLIVMGAGKSVASSEIFLLNLVITEALSCVASIFIVITYLSNVHFMTFIVFTSVLLCVSRPMFQCCICVERFLAVVRPVVFLRYKPLRYKVVCCGVTWVGVFGCSVGIISLKRLTHVLYFHLGYVGVMFSIQLICSVLILRALRQTRPGEGDRNGEMANTKLRAFKVVLLITVVMTVNYLPMMLLLVFHSFLSSSQLSLATSVYFAILVPIGFVQPLVFIHRAGKLPCIRGC